MKSCLQNFILKSCFEDTTLKFYIEIVFEDTTSKFYTEVVSSKHDFKILH